MAEILGNLIKPDLMFAFALIAIALFVFFAVRVGALPVKGVPFVVATLLAAVGFGVWRERRSRDLHRELKAREKVLREKDKELAELKKQYDLADQEVADAIARRDAEVQALAEEILQIRALRDDELARIRAMTAAERRDYVLNMQF